MNEKLTPFDGRMTKTIANLNSELSTIRAGRANPHVLDRIMVDYYGAPTPLQQVANITVPEARMLQIQPWEPSLVQPIVKAVQVSNLGINPNTDGKIIRLQFPELTEERRKELVKDAKVKGEEAKVAIRNIRRDGNDTLKKLENKELSEDQVKDLQSELQKLTDKYIKDIDAAVEEKSKEIMTV